jgi:hypothetical protein
VRGMTYKTLGFHSPHRIFSRCLLALHDDGMRSPDLGSLDILGFYVYLNIFQAIKVRSIEVIGRWDIH